VEEEQRGDTTRSVPSRDEVSAAGRKRRLGLLVDSGSCLPESFFDTLPEEELRLWNGEGE
jgi:hypothetical protein